MMKSVFSLLVLTTMILFFQNCVDQSTKTASSDSVAMQAGGSGNGGNGDPYGGKGSYMAFTPGHSCMSASGSLVAAPFSRAFKQDGHVVLAYDNCADKNEVLDSRDVQMAGDGSDSFIYKRQIFQNFASPPPLTSAQFYFPDATCVETIESVMTRSGTISSPPAPGATVTENRIRASLSANWFADRHALVGSENITRAVPLAGQMVRDTITPVWNDKFSPLIRVDLAPGTAWTGPRFSLQVAPPSGVPLYLSTNQVGTLSFEHAGEPMTVKVECAVFY